MPRDNQLVHLTRKNIGLYPRRPYVALFSSAAQVTRVLSTDKKGMKRQICREADQRPKETATVAAVSKAANRKTMKGIGLTGY